MSKVNPYLRFPSGRTIKDVKCDAKRFARTADISHTRALDTLVRVNGLDMCWAEAMNELFRAQHRDRHSNDNRVVSRSIHTLRVGHDPGSDQEQPRQLEAEKPRALTAYRTERRRVRHALELYHEGYMSIAAIAETCGMSRIALEFHIYRANRLNRARLTGRSTMPNRAGRVRQHRIQRRHERE